MSMSEAKMNKENVTSLKLVIDQITSEKFSKAYIAINEDSRKSVDAIADSKRNKL